VFEEFVLIVAVSKLDASRSQQNRTTLQHEQRSPGDWRQLRSRKVAKLPTLYWWLEPCGGGGGGMKSFAALEHAIWWRLLQSIFLHPTQCEFYTSAWTAAEIHRLSFTVLDHPPYIPDYTWLPPLPGTEEDLTGHHLLSADEVKTAVKKWFH
jgi:hypothetical protein